MPGAVRCFLLSALPLGKANFRSTRRLVSLTTKANLIGMFDYWLFLGLAESSLVLPTANIPFCVYLNDLFWLIDTAL